MGAPLGVLLDYAGVMTVPLEQAIGTFSAREGVDASRLREVVGSAYVPGAAPSDIHALERGELALADFDVRFAAALAGEAGGGPDPRGLTRRLFSHLPAEPLMVELVDRLRASGIAVGLLSNSWGGAEGYDRAWLEAHFDAAVLSGELGIRKPGPEMFALAARRLELAPADVLFVDDFPVNVQAAERAGLRAMRHVSARTTAARVAEIFAWPAR